MPTLDAIDVDEPITVVINQTNAAARHLGELMDWRTTVVLNEDGQAGILGQVTESGDQTWRRSG